MNKVMGTLFLYLLATCALGVATPSASTASANAISFHSVHTSADVSHSMPQSSVHVAFGCVSTSNKCIVICEGVRINICEASRETDSEKPSESLRVRDGSERTRSSH